MGEVLSKIGKIAQFVIVTALVAAFFVSAVNIITAILADSDLGQFDYVITNYLRYGRELANNFIPAKAFNGCIALWFLGSSALIGDYLVTVIGGKISGNR